MVKFPEFLGRPTYVVNVQCSVQYTLLNVGNILLCVIYQLNFTLFMYVKRISRNI